MENIVFLVIGSNCFSASHFINYALISGYKVWGISRSKEPNNMFLPYKWEDNNFIDSSKSKNYNFVQLNINFDLKEIIELIDQVKPTHVINFAAQGMVAESWKTPVDWYQTNVISQVAFHDKLREKDFLEKYVHVTTPEVYGNTINEWTKEHFCFSPSTPYAVSRASCDLHLISFFKAYNFPVVFTRAANVYGPGQQLYRIIPRAILSALTGRKLFLHGGGTSSRSFIHITDVVSGTMEIALKGEPGKTWHLSTRKIVSIKDLVKLICEITNVEFGKIVEIGQERLGKDQNYLLDSSSIRDEFNWDDKIMLEDGIKETIKWVENNLDQMLEIPWNYIHKK